MTQLGNSASGFTTRTDTNGEVVANKYTAASSFTPLEIKVGFDDAFGSSGTIYVAVYSDNAGSPGSLLFSGSIAFASSFGGVKTIPITGVLLNSGSVYWMVAYIYSNGTHQIDYDSRNSPVDQDVLSWIEGAAGSWTNNPTPSVLQSDREVRLYTDDATPTTTSTSSSSTSTTTTSHSTSTTSSSTSITTSSSSTSTTSHSTSSISTSSTSTSSTSTSSTSSSTSSTSTSSTSISTSITSSSTSSTSSSSTSSTSSSTSTTTTLPFVRKPGIMVEEERVEITFGR